MITAFWIVVWLAIFALVGWIVIGPLRVLAVRWLVRSFTLPQSRDVLAMIMYAVVYVVLTMAAMMLVLAVAYVGAWIGGASL